MKSFDVINDLSEYLSIKINSMLEIYHDGSWKESKVHSDYDIWYITEGKAVVEIEGVDYAAHEGDVVFFYPGITYNAHTDGEGCSFIFLHFNFGIGNNLQILDEFDFAGVIPGELTGKEGLLFKQAWNEYKADYSRSLMILKGYFSILVSKIVSIGTEKSGRINHFPKNRTLRSPGKLSTLLPALRYISDNIGKKISNSELAHECGMSEKYFINYFKSIIGITPNIFITQQKMNRAADFICRKEFSVKQIAHMLGYSDQYNFSKVFKKYFKVAPTYFIK